MRYAFVLLMIVGQFWSHNVSAQNKQITVVIDPGHGGSDPGHESDFSGHLSEKDLNLTISKYLGGYIEKYLQNVKVVYTRKTDVFPSLDDRVAKANKIKADYFISIHCNGFDNKAVKGTESHVHSMQLTKSVALANAIEHQFSTRADRKSRGVKDAHDLQHSLQVLKYTNMPSVLIECGYITNKSEGNYLNTTKGQEIIASAIFRGFRATLEKEYPAIAFRKANPSQTTSASLASSGHSYAIQIMSSKEPVNTDDSGFKRLKMTVVRTKLNTKSAYKYIYTVGEYGSRKEAKKHLSTVQKRGYKDAIIIRR
jgi:N-acetylmuramoyl-L-alanine amidase